MIGRFFVALLVGLSVTGLELLVVAGFNRPVPHPTEQEPERLLAPRVVAAPRPRAEDPRPAEQQTLTKAPAPIAPAPFLAAPALPELADLHPTLDLLDVLPSLPTSARGGGAVGSIATPEPDTQAVPLRRPAPLYPHAARQRGIEGFVVVRLRVDPSGRVTDVVVVESEPPGVFDESARSAARGYTFTPARARGTAVASTLEQKIVFKLR